MQKAIRVCILCGLSAACLQAGFVPMSLSSVANTTLSTFPALLNGNLFPTGSQTFDGVQFSLGPVWSADVAAGGQLNQGLEQVIIPINAPDVLAVSTLIGSEWGETLGTFVSLIFNFNNGTTYTVGLVEDQAIRDYNNYNWPDAISGSWSAPGGLTDSTVNVWTDNGLTCLPQADSNGGNAPPITCSTANGTYQRLDMQTINLPVSTQSLTLVSLTVVDGGNHPTVADASNPAPSDAERSFIAGLSVDESAQSVPEPGTWALLLGGFGAMTALRKRRAS